MNILNIKLILNTVLIYYVVTLLNTYTTYASINLNTNMVLNLNYLWTNVNFKFVFYTYLTLYLTKRGYSYKNLNVFLLTIILYNNQVNFNWTLTHLSLYYVEFNSLLINRLNSIHPPLLYLTASLLVINVSGVVLTGYSNYFNLVLDKYTYYSRLVIILNFAVISSLLGSLWAFQEGTWGGWWAWDPSEMLNFTLILITLVLLHTYYITYKPLKQLKNLVITFLLMVTNFLFLQLNFALTSHNFGNSLTIFNSTVLFVGSLLVIYTIYQRMFYKNLKYTPTKILPIKFKLYLSLTYYYTNLDLINYFILTTIYLNINYVYFNLSVVLDVFYINISMYILPNLTLNYLLVSFSVNLIYSQRIPPKGLFSNFILHTVLILIWRFILNLKYLNFDTSTLTFSYNWTEYLYLLEYTYNTTVRATLTTLTYQTFNVLNYFNFTFYNTVIELTIVKGVIYLINYIPNLQSLSILLNLDLIKLPTITLIVLMYIYLRGGKYGIKSF